MNGGIAVVIAAGGVVAGVVLILLVVFFDGIAGKKDCEAAPGLVSCSFVVKANWFVTERLEDK